MPHHRQTTPQRLGRPGCTSADRCLYRNSHRLAGAVRIAFLTGALLGAPLAHAQDQPSRDAFQRLVAPDTGTEDRLRLAAEILAGPTDTEAFRATADLLAEPPGRPEDAEGAPVRAMLQALGRASSPPRPLIAPVIALAKNAASPWSLEAIAALRAFRSREAAAALVHVISDSPGHARGQAAHRSLVVLTGRDDIPIRGWGPWLAEALNLSDRQWEHALAEAHARRAQSLAERAERAETQLADAWRRIHLLTPPDQRSEVLAQLLESPTPALRALGFDLVNREIGESRYPGAAVADAAISLLKHESPAVRADAALLLNRLAPAQAEAPVLAALERETDPHAADALLLAITRWPAPGAVRPTLRWLADERAPRARAAQSAWALQRAGVLDSPEDREAALEAVRAFPDKELNTSACRLLAVLGDEEDLSRLRILLGAEDAGQRVAAAEALALVETEVNTLLAAATADPTLFEACARALRTHLKDARGYDALRRLPAPSARVRAAVLADYAALLPTPEIVRLARLAPEPGEAVSLLQPLLDSSRAADPEAHTQLAEGILLLAEKLALTGTPGEALRALDAIPQGAVPARTVADRRVTLLLTLGRVEDAGSIEASAEAWLAGLERALGEPHAPQIADTIETLFPELEREQAERLSGLRQRLASLSEPDTEGG
jgi:hypothetical protein